MTLRERIAVLAAQALTAWGNASQRLHAAEECAELIVALSHVRRGRSNIDVAGEIADVLIMAEQMRISFGPETVDARIVEKLDRLEGKLREHTQNRDRVSPKRQEEQRKAAAKVKLPWET